MGRQGGKKGQVEVDRSQRVGDRVRGAELATDNRQLL